MRVLVFFAHPDDETMLAGGTLALLARAGAEIFYLSATRGEGGEMGEPPMCTREDLGRLREAELACAVQALGGGQLQFLDFVDPTVGPDNTLYPFDADMPGLVMLLQKIILEQHIDALITHGSDGEYGHPAHLRVHQAAALTVAGMGAGAPLFYTWQACYEGHPKARLANRNDTAHLILDVSSVLQMKINAALCHRTQHALFVRNASKDSGWQMTVPEVIVAGESLHRVSPPVTDGPVDDALAALLRSSGAVREA